MHSWTTCRKDGQCIVKRIKQGLKGLERSGALHLKLDKALQLSCLHNYSNAISKHIPTEPNQRRYPSQQKIWEALLQASVGKSENDWMIENTVSICKSNEMQFSTCRTCLRNCSTFPRLWFSVQLGSLHRAGGQIWARLPSFWRKNGQQWPKHR